MIEVIRNMIALLGLVLIFLFGYYRGYNKGINDKKVVEEIISIIEDQIEENEDEKSRKTS